MKSIFGLLLAVIEVANCRNPYELLSIGSSKFTAKMFATVANYIPDDSFVISPFSILTPLAQFSLASIRNTRDELLTALGLPNDEATKSAFKYMSDNFLSENEVILRTLNKVYVSKRYPIDKDYADMIRETFKVVDILNLGFYNESYKIVQQINTWVHMQTDHTIDNVFNPELLQSSTKLLFVNAIYFKGIWQYPFNKNSTSGQDFYVTKQLVTKVPTMYGKGLFNFGKSTELNAKILEIPYADNEFLYYVILPNDIEGIAELRDKLNPSVLAKALRSLRLRKMEIYMPKFKIETSINLVNILPKVGVKGIFDPVNADLTRIVGGRSDLFVKDGIHMAFLEINEGVTTDDFVSDQDGYKDLHTFEADHPFVFLITHRENIVLTGVYYS